MIRNKSNVKSIYFWNFQQTRNRYEYYLELQDKRLLEMYEDGFVVLLVYSTIPRGLFKKSVRTIELQKSKKEGLARLNQLLSLDRNYIDVNELIVKPAYSERFNLSLYPTNNLLIIHRFEKDQPLPKFAFDTVQDAESFLSALNVATQLYLTENNEKWQELNC